MVAFPVSVWSLQILCAHGYSGFLHHQKPVYSCRGTGPELELVPGCFHYVVLNMTKDSSSPNEISLREERIWHNIQIAFSKPSGKKVLWDPVD